MLIKVQNLPKKFRIKEKFCYIQFTKLLLIFFLLAYFISLKKQFKKTRIKNEKNENINKNINKSININSNIDINSNISNYVNIAVNFDNKYIYPFITFLTSLLDNRADSTFYIVHILTGYNFKNNTSLKIKSVIDKFGKNYCNVSFYNLGFQFMRATSGKYISTASYYRISLPSLLPNVDKIIYIDTDVINFKDLSEMYNIELDNDTYFCGPLDFANMKDELRDFHIFPEKYINSGISLMNLKAMRNNDIENQLRKFVSSHFLNHHEQTAINVLCLNNTQILPYKFAFFALFNSTDQLIKYNNEQSEKYKYNETELIQAFYNPVSLHYAGWTKPWQKEYQLTNSAYWWYYAKKSGFYQEILNNYGFKNEEVENILKKTPDNGKLIKYNFD